MINYVIADGSISLVLDGELMPPVLPSHINHKVIMKLLLDGASTEEVRKALDVREVFGLPIKNLIVGDLSINEDGTASFNGITFPTTIGKRIVDLAMNGTNPMPIVRFLEKAIGMPTSSREALFIFMEKGKLPIYEDGDIMAFKSIRPNYRDWFTGKVDNSPGETPLMPRLLGNTDPNINCADGFHIGTFEYANTFHSYDGRKIVIIKCNPKDVISVPSDANCGKIRCTSYCVVEDFEDFSLDSNPCAVYNTSGGVVTDEYLDEYARAFFDSDFERHLEEDDDYEDYYDYYDEE